MGICVWPWQSRLLLLGRMCYSWKPAAIVSATMITTSHYGIEWLLSQSAVVLFTLLPKSTTSFVRHCAHWTTEKTLVCVYPSFSVTYFSIWYKHTVCVHTCTDCVWHVHICSVCMLLTLLQYATYVRACDSGWSKGQGSMVATDSLWVGWFGWELTVLPGTVAVVVAGMRGGREGKESGQVPHGTAE